VTTIQQIEYDVLGEIINVSQLNAPAIQQWIANEEAAAQAGLVNLIKNIPSIKGAIGLIATPIEGAVEAAITAYVAAFLAKETPATVFAAWIALLQNLQKDASST
jgi:hypothetical protein